MAPMKRPAAAMSPRANLGKKLRNDPVVVDCGEVACLIQEAQGYPNDVLGMLANAVQDCMAETKETRHSFQGRVIGMLGDILATVERDAGTLTYELEAKVTGADSEKLAREHAIEAAVNEVTSKTETLDAVKAAHAEALGLVHQTRKAKAEAEQSQVAGDRAYNDAAEKKTKLETTRNTEYQQLKDGTPGALKIFPKFAKTCKEFGFDPNLITSGQKTFGTPAAGRGSFDDMVLKQIDEAFTKAIQQQEDILASGEAGKAQREADVQQAIQACTVAVEAEIGRKTEVAEATTALNNAHTHKRACDKALKDLGPEMRQFATDLGKAREKQQSVANVMSKFQGLVNRSNQIQQQILEEMLIGGTEAVTA